jgi:hypothetical protein
VTDFVIDVETVFYSCSLESGFEGFDMLGRRASVELRKRVIYFMTHGSQHFRVVDKAAVKDGSSFVIDAVEAE